MCKTTSFIIITAITLSSFQCWWAMRRRTSACSRVTPRTVQRYWRRDDQPRTQRWINCTLSFVRTSENCRRPMRPRAHDWRHINNVLSVLHEYRETITIKKTPVLFFRTLQPIIKIFIQPVPCIICVHTVSFHCYKLVWGHHVLLQPQPQLWMWRALNTALLNTVRLLTIDQRAEYIQSSVQRKDES